MHRILIVEDAPAEADALESCLRRWAEESGEQIALERLGSATEFMATRRAADLVFMDIDMPGLSGMEAAEHLRTYDEQTPLVFVTNLAQYAAHGYAVDALDFLVKPVTYEGVSACMARALRAIRRNAGTTIALATPEGLRVLPLSQIAYVDILRHDLYYHLAEDGEVLRLRGSIRAAAEELGDAFVRISASCLVNMGQVRLVRQGSVVMADGTELFYSRGCRKAALETLAAYVGRSV